MEVKAIGRVFPEIPEIKRVDFSRYSTPYMNILVAFKESNKSGLKEFEEFIMSHGGTKEDVGRFLISVFQYLLIRYRRFNDENVEVPVFKLFLTLKGWLIENGFRRDYLKLLHSFVGYIVDIAEKIARKSDCEIGIVYMKTAYSLTLEANEEFREEYFRELKRKVDRMLKSLYEQCGIGESIPERQE